MQASFAPELETRPARQQLALAVKDQVASAPLAQQPYEAASMSRRLFGWRAPATTANGLLGVLNTLRDRSRNAVRNDGFAKAIIDTLVSNLVGTGIVPLPLVKDLVLRTAMSAAWGIWSYECDADGALDFEGLTSQATRCWLEAGEVFVRRRDRLAKDGLSVPMQVQVLEPEFCPHTYMGFAANGNRIRAGIEFNAIGQRVAYYFYPARPELDDMDRSQLRRVPADSVIHLFDPLRPGQLRGLPVLTQALIRLHELDKFDDATLLKQQLQNLFVGFIKRDAGYGDAADLHPLTGQAKESGDPPTLSLEPGVFQELEPGEDVTFSDPPAVQGGYVDFMRQQLRAACRSAGVPYEIATGDMSGINDRTARVLLNEFKRRMTMLQHQIIAFKFCRPLWNWWLDAAFFADAFALPAAYAMDPTPWQAVKWMAPRWDYIHPVQDVEADIKAVAAGFKSRSDVVAEYGDDAEQIDAQQAADNTRADALNLKYSSDGRYAVKAPTSSASENADGNSNADSTLAGAAA